MSLSLARKSLRLLALCGILLSFVTAQEAGRAQRKGFRRNL